MSTQEKIRTRCPACKAHYTVPGASLGHHARCVKCGLRFRVEEFNPHPSEDDILRWLNEGLEEYEFVDRSRISVDSRDERSRRALRSEPEPALRARIAAEANALM